MNSLMEEYDVEQLKNNLRHVLTLEYFGIRIDDVKERLTHSGIMQQIYYFSVPESSTMEINDEDLKDKIKTSEGLISIGKESLIDIVVEQCKDIIDDEEEFRNNISDYFKFYAKVRTGEVWTKELAEATMKTIADEVKAAAEYEEV